MPAVDRDGVLGLQLDVREECERASVHARLQPKSDKCVALPFDEEARHADWPLLQGALLSCEP